LRSKPKQTVQLAMKELGYDDYEGFLKENNFAVKKNKLKIILFVKSNNRSHAYNYFSNKEVDLVVVYCKNSYGFFTNHYVISHELLRQFGAWDLYYGESQSREKADQAKRLYPKSIMINNFEKADLRVDELTAWRVGWHNKFKEEYQSFAPVYKEGPKTRSKGNSLRFDLGGGKKKKNDGG